MNLMIGESTHILQGPILDCCWHDDGTKVFMASCDKQVKCWDLASNQAVQVAEHGAPVKSVRWVKAPNYTALMTGSWDKTLKFWDTRSPNPIMNIDLGERCYCADVDYPMAVVGTAGRGIIIYTLEGQPKEFKRIDPPLKYQHRCISIFRDKKASPTGWEPYLYSDLTHLRLRFVDLCLYVLPTTIAAEQQLNNQNRHNIRKVPNHQGHPIFVVSCARQ